MRELPRPPRASEDRTADRLRSLDLLTADDLGPFGHRASGARAVAERLGGLGGAGFALAVGDASGLAAGALRVDVGLEPAAEAVVGGALAGAPARAKVLDLRSDDPADRGRPPSATHFGSRSHRASPKRSTREEGWCGLGVARRLGAKTSRCAARLARRGRRSIGSGHPPRGMKGVTARAQPARRGRPSGLATSGLAASGWQRMRWRRHRRPQSELDAGSGASRNSSSNPAVSSG
jgi:hypothetical protein